ncbi:carboxypeptidase-like regulatory domain-containing protein [Olleya sp. YS]|uniref:carboxypeptidase-like regulatory domain-containing protein n=1 Tax=Olleya sp. YS TaxID=3028318 RepID=UPI0024344F1D|nr:carboxypeptidase-like regulatory domain-containing protein [Olleya sp. YS]WGD34001.1 carboxypeptidase-like regulatory domain-containing protein [Olleya sp. YS]
MKNQFNLSIKTPCQENFNSFSTTKAGGFCNSCNQEVIDFTTMNTEEISHYFTINNPENTCGRFNQSQLNTYTMTPDKRPYLSLLSGIGLACFSLLSLTTAQAQDTPSNATDKEIKQTTKKVTVKGHIKDQNGIPLPGVNVVLEGTEIGASSDFDGNFQFPQKLKQGDVLVFSYVGYQSKKTVIDTTNASSNMQLNINMDDEAYIMMGRVDVKQVYKSKKD